MEKSSLLKETFYVNSSLKDNTKFYENYENLKMFNNVENADRKLVINNYKYEFWVHDDILSNASNLYYNLINNNNNNNNKDIEFNNVNHRSSSLLCKNYIVDNIPILCINIEEDESLNKSVIPDIILWIYTKDFKKIKKYTKNIKVFVAFYYLLFEFNINKHFLKNYFIDKLTILIDESDYNYIDKAIKWSSYFFDFNHLILLLDYIKLNKDNNIKNNKILIYKLINKWVRDSIKDTDAIKDTKTIKENRYNIYLVKEYLNKQNILIDLTLKDFKKLILDNIENNNVLISKSDNYIDTIDTIDKVDNIASSQYLLENYIFSNKLKCIVCSKIFNSMQEIYYNKDYNCNFSNKLNKVSISKFVNNEKEFIHNHISSKEIKNRLNFEELCSHKYTSITSNLINDNYKNCIIVKNNHLLVIV